MVELISSLNLLCYLSEDLSLSYNLTYFYDSFLT
jgi:hypothetical protein